MGNNNIHSQITSRNETVRFGNQLQAMLNIPLNRPSMRQALSSGYEADWRAGADKREELETIRRTRETAARERLKDAPDAPEVEAPEPPEEAP